MTMSENPGTATRAASLVDALLPNRTDAPLDDISYAKFTDRGVKVALSGVDLLLVAMARRVLTDRAVGSSAVALLPRARHRSALLLAITSHILCRQDPVGFRGPVVLIGLDIDLVEQLRHLSVEGYRRMGLHAGNPLSAHRLTRDGTVQPLIGSDVRDVDRTLIYFNTRVGQPTLRAGSPLVILDGTSVTNPGPRARALAWALDQGPAGLIAIGDLGDDGLVESLTKLGQVPTVIALTRPVATNLVEIFNCAAPPESMLSSMAMLGDLTKVEIHRVVDAELNEAIAHAYHAVAAKPPVPMPRPLQVPINLWRNGVRLAARVGDYKAACAMNPRPGEMPSLNWLGRMDPQLPPEWKAWKATRWGTLRVSVTTIWRLLEEECPKLTRLWGVLDQVSRDCDGGILIRCHSRAAAIATRTSLSSGDRSPAQIDLWNDIGDRVRFATFKDRLPSGTFDAQILTGAPPPWLFSIFLSTEARATHVILYEAEEATLRRTAGRIMESLNGWQHAACRTLGAAAEKPSNSPLPEHPPHEVARAEALLHLPRLSLSDVLDVASSVMDPEESGDASSPLTAGSSTQKCIPVTLEDGRVWWSVVDDGASRPVVVVTAGGHENRLVSDLRTGDQIVVPVGEGTESIYARLVALAHGDDDVKALDLILSQFRTVARELLDRGRADAIAAVRIAGAAAPDQLPHWAEGTTIAPHNPEDVAAVFAAAGRPQPNLSLIYAVADALRSLNRVIGRFLAAITRGAGEDAVAKLRSLVGDTALELIDEFELARVRSVGTVQEVSATIAGTIR